MNLGTPTLRLISRILFTAQKNVAARGLTLPIERGPDNRAFIGISESRGLRCLAATRRPQPISSVAQTLVRGIAPSQTEVCATSPAGMQCGYTAGQIFKPNIGKARFRHHGRKLFLIRKPGNRIRKVFIRTA